MQISINNISLSTLEQTKERTKQSSNVGVIAKHAINAVEYRKDNLITNMKAVYHYVMQHLCHLIKDTAGEADHREKNKLYQDLNKERAEFYDAFGVSFSDIPKNNDDISSEKQVEMLSHYFAKIKNETGLDVLEEFLNLGNERNEIKNYFQYMKAAIEPNSVLPLSPEVEQFMEQAKEILTQQYAKTFDSKVFLHFDLGPEIGFKEQYLV